MEDLVEAVVTESVPEVAERAVQEESKGARSQNSGSIKLPQIFALKNLRNHISNDIDGTRGGGFDGDWILFEGVHVPIPVVHRHHLQDLHEW